MTAGEIAKLMLGLMVIKFLPITLYEIFAWFVAWRRLRELEKLSRQAALKMMDGKND